MLDWHKRFRDGTVDITDDLPPGRPCISDGATRVQDAISEDKQRSIREIANITVLTRQCA